MEKSREVWVLSSLRVVLDWITGSPWRYFTLIFLLSLAIRINQVNQVNRRYLLPTDDRELGAIAISLMKTGEFANTYIIPTGPTAHLPPVPPLIDSLIYRALGLTSRAGYVRALSIIITGSVLYGMLPWFSEWLGTGRAAGVIAGLVGGGPGPGQARFRWPITACFSSTNCPSSENDCWKCCASH